MDNKLFAVNKPKGITSAKFIYKVRKIVSNGRARIKIGHAGTLDPNASGVLVVGTGSCTKLLSQVMKQNKEYIGIVFFGSTSTTYDDLGTKTHISNMIPELKAIEHALEKFIGIVDQVPPAYSAIHINGMRAYKLARSQTDFVIPSRKVVIHSIDILEYAYPLLKLKVRCGPGTYIRSIAKDLGDALECGAYLKDLERITSGGFSISDCIDLSSLNNTTGA